MVVANLKTGTGPGSKMMPEQAVSQTDFIEATRPLIGPVVTIARRILGDEGAAWDAVQEALVTLWIQDVKPSNLRSWLACAVTHRSLHLARCQSRRRKHEIRACLQRAEGQRSRRSRTTTGKSRSRAQRR